jgi:hypothetical protein
LELSSIKLSWASGFVVSSFNFKHIFMVDHNVSLTTNGHKIGSKHKHFE